MARAALETCGDAGVEDFNAAIVAVCDASRFRGQFPGLPDR
jgi:hypothetical protein